MPANHTRELRFERACRQYEKLIAPLTKLLEVAEKTGFPEEHIHRLKHLIAELIAIAELGNEGVKFPKRGPGRPHKDALTYEQHCCNHFLSVCPTFMPLKKSKDKGIDSVGKVLPQPGLKFDFKTK